MNRNMDHIRWRVKCLKTVDLVAKYNVWDMQAYLTDIWKMSFTQAAATINVFTGLVAILPIAMAFLRDAFTGSHRMLQLSTVAYCTGLCLLAMSTPPVLAQATGTCSEYEPACIGKVQSVLFYTALSLIAVGMSGHSISFESTLDELKISLEEQRTNGVGEEDESGTHFWCFELGSWALYIGMVVSAITLFFFVKNWAFRFGITAIISLAGSLFFFSEPCCYTPPSSKTPGRDDLGNKLLPHTRENRFWTAPLRMIPVLMTFMVSGLVLSIGNTYFIEQANHMNRKVGSLTVPLQILLISYETVKSRTVETYKSWSPTNINPVIHAARGFFNGMFWAVLCCITAALVEAKRISVIKKYDLLDKPDDTIPMTMFWLLFQFCFLGYVDGFVRMAIESFFGSQVPNSTEASTALFTEGIFGAGAIGSVLSIFLSGKYSERGGKPSWFQYTLNKSRLDKYYWTLAILSAVNFVFNFVVTLVYHRGTELDQELEIEETIEASR